MPGSKLHRSLLLLLSGLTLAAPAHPTVAAPTACRDGATRLCLRGRFEVEASWTGRGGRQQAATAVPISPTSGAFAFFDARGADLLVRADRTGDGSIVARLGALTDTAFELRVLDTRSGATWTYSGARGRLAAGSLSLTETAPLQSTDDIEPGPPAMVANLLEEGDDTAPEKLFTGPGSRCADTPTALCLLGGRFRVEADFGADHRRGNARLIEGGTSGLFSHDGSAPDVAIRMVDGRSVNGCFWLLASGLGASDVTVRATDLLSGRTRLLTLSAGAPSSQKELQAFSEQAATVQVALDDSLAVVQTIGPAGGSIRLADAQGTQYVLSFPPQALAVLTNITVTPVASIADLPFAALAAGVRIEPEGLIPATSVGLAITPSTPVPQGDQLTFGFRGLDGELYLTPPRARQAALVIPVHRLGGYGLATGSAADLAAQLLRVPSREEDHFAQRLAGLLLPLRRAGNLGPLPATVLQLFQTEYATAIKPLLGPIGLGTAHDSLRLTRSYRDAANDTGLASRLKGMASEKPRGGGGNLGQLMNAEVKGAKVALKKNLAICVTGADGNARLEAVFQAFNAYVVLKYYKSLGASDTTRMLNCASFTLRFDTTLDGDDGTTHEHHIVPSSDSPKPLDIALSLDLAQGRFYGNAPSTDKASLTIKNCETVQKSNTNGVFFADRLYMNRMNPYEADFLALLVPAFDLHYGISQPFPLVTFGVVCSGVASQDQQINWPTLYGFFHTDEIQDGGEGLHNEFHIVLDRSADPQKIAERVFARSMNLAGTLREDSSFILFHKPRG